VGFSAVVFQKLRQVRRQFFVAIIERDHFNVFIIPLELMLKRHTEESGAYNLNPIDGSLIFLGPPFYLSS
jgi:hypothetical protein